MGCSMCYKPSIALKMKIKLHIIQASLLACCLSWLSCSSDADLPAVAERSISFTQAAFFLPAQDKTSVTIALTKAAESDLTVGFSLSGTAVERSEERRVGKECRSRWSP